MALDGPSCLMCPHSKRGSPNLSCNSSQLLVTITATPSVATLGPPCLPGAPCGHWILRSGTQEDE